MPNFRNMTLTELKRGIPYIIIALCAILPFAHLTHTVLHYEAHTDAGFGPICTAVLFGLIALAAGISYLYLRERAKTIFAAVVVVVCVGVLVLAARIPNCPECDHTTREQLGILSHWIEYWTES